MGPDLHSDLDRDLPTAPVVARCPACGGAVRPDAPWCGQCWTAISAPGAATAAADPTSPAVPAASSPAEPPSLSPAAPVDWPAAAGVTSDVAVWPCTACGTGNALTETACSACGTGFLAALHAGEPLLVLPVVGDLAALSRAARLGLAAAVVLVVVLLVALAGLLLS